MHWIYNSIQNKALSLRKQNKSANSWVKEGMQTKNTKFNIDEKYVRILEYKLFCK